MIDLQERSPKILVVGDLMIDHYLWGSCERISPEAPVQVVNIDQESLLLGGGGNVINNLKALGAEVDVISVIGECDISKKVKLLLDRIKVDTTHLSIESGRITSKKSRVIASQHQVLRFDHEKIESISTKSQKDILNTFMRIIKKYDIVLLSDYGKGVLTYQLTKSIISVANENNKKVLVDPKGSDYSKYKGAYLLTPNKKEAGEATKISIKDKDSLNKAIIKLKEECDLNISIVTLSDKGIAVYDNDFRIYPTANREVFDVTGAGDTVLASLGFSLSCGFPIDNAIEFSNLAAGVVVAKIGSSTASIDEIIEYESNKTKLRSIKNVKSIGEIQKIVEDSKSIGKKIVFTNGCFDLIHTGHIKYLETSKSFGDILIVGINSDRSVSSLKGPSRPINSEDERAHIIAALESVDYVVIFDEEDPYNLIKSLKPHILTKGSDYDIEEVVGHDLVDELKLVDFIEGKSTSQLVNEIQRSK